MIKTYICKTRKVLSYPIKIKKEIHTLKFTGGDPPIRYSTFQTDNPILQDAIEKNPAYGIKFELERGQQLGQPAKKPGKTVKVGNMVITEKQPTQKKKQDEKKEPPIVDNEVTSGQKAKNFLWGCKKLEGKFTAKMLQNNAKIIETAKKLNVIFPNWPQFNE